MRFELALKRFFPVVIATFLGTAAYFQARGLGSLVAASALPTASSAKVGAPRPVGLSREESGHATNADKILERNPFDSVTGSLVGKKEAPSIPDALGEPPACESVRVLLITESDEASWSFASILEGAGPARLRRVGDDVTGSKLESIAWDRVVLANASGRCQVKLGAQAAAPPPKPVETAKKPVGLAGEVAQKIHRVDDRNFTVERGVIDTVLEHQAELFGRLRVTPEKEGDRVVGIKLNGIKSDNVLGQLGLLDGDRLSSINGFDLSDPQHALEAYARLRGGADHLSIAIVRQGSPMTIDVKIQ